MMWWRGRSYKPAESGRIPNRCHRYTSSSSSSHTLPRHHIMMVSRIHDLHHDLPGQQPRSLVQRPNSLNSGLPSWTTKDSQPVLSSQTSWVNHEGTSWELTVCLLWGEERAFFIESDPARSGTMNCDWTKWMCAWHHVLMPQKNVTRKANTRKWSWPIAYPHYVFIGIAMLLISSLSVFASQNVGYCLLISARNPV